ncbi:MAG TPA: hypothetical protein VMT63_08390 [Bacteroidales bacterium]|nr:hypothetical protein [Bacteroidales bacterium]
MKYLLLSIIAVLFSSTVISQTDEKRLDEIFSKTYRNYIISQGDNLPDFDSRKDNTDRFLVSLSYGIAPDYFMKKAGWTSGKYESRVRFLIEKGWVKKTGDKLTPTVFIVSEEKGELLYKYAKPVSEAIAASIEKDLPYILQKYQNAGFDKKYSFGDLSFLILSDVLLDNWQIMNMEAAFLKQENRPERHGKFYYASIEENSGDGYEPFKIYGNQSGRINDSIWINIYGNNRIEANTRLADIRFRDSVAVSCLHLKPSNYNYFDEIAAEFRPALVKILEDNRDYSMKVYRKTGYSEQIRFEEFFIWWYHFIYTETTNILAGKKIIKKPASGNFFYL